jgi:hypothetical protein
MQNENEIEDTITDGLMAEVTVDTQETELSTEVLDIVPSTIVERR